MAQDQKPISKERKFSFSVGYKVGFEMTSYLKNTSTGIKYDMNNGSVGPIFHFVSFRSILTMQLLPSGRSA